MDMNMPKFSFAKSMVGLLPLNHISWVFGKFAELRWPAPLNYVLLAAFSKAYGINLGEASKPLADYRSLQEFFTRELKPEARPLPDDLEQSVVSPVDGKLRSCGAISDGRLPQIKGKDYSVASLLGDGEVAGKFSGGFFYNLYLSPTDYHHVHSPISGRIIKCTYIPGFLWPVNDWSLTRVESLFSVNERLVIYIQSDHGLMVVVMVGATNVGKMTVSFDPSIETNSCRKTSSQVMHDYAEGVGIKAGQRLGTFQLGSSVILLAEPGLLVDPELPRAGLVKQGQLLYQFSKVLTKR